VDYRALKVVTIRDYFSISIIDKLLNELGSTTIFTTIDLYLEYHQIRLNLDDTHKMAFKISNGHYEILVMSFALTNASLIFEETMNNLLQPYFRLFVLLYFNDILGYNPRFQDHLIHLEFSEIVC